MYNKKIKISVICPVYNGEKYIDKSILSILNQSALPNEVIFCDDGSIDSSYSKIKKYEFRFMKKKIRFIVLRSNHLGPGAARNKCIKKSTCEYISFLDSDDIWFKNKIKIIKEIISLNLDKNFFIHWEKNISLKGSKILKHAQTINKNENLTLQLYKKNSFSTSAVTCNKKIFGQLLKFDTSLPNAQDYDLWLKMSKKIKLETVPQILGAYIERENNITNRYYFYKLKSLLRIVYRYKSEVNLIIFYIKLLKTIFSKQWLKII